jgi:hypothetical protein
MPRRFRRYARSARAVKPIRYSNETGAAQTGGTIPGHTTLVSVLVAPSTSQGVRKVKNPTLRIVTTAPNPTTPLLWALVYVPQGFPQTALKLTSATGGDTPISIFEPNQNVMMSGWLNDLGSHDPVTFRSRLARNLDSGDMIALLIANPLSAETSVGIAYSLNYTICYG